MCFAACSRNLLLYEAGNTPLIRPGICQTVLFSSLFEEAMGVLGAWSTCLLSCYARALRTSNGSWVLPIWLAP